MIRKHLGLTQAVMAERLTVSQSAYEKYERGERGVPSVLLEKARSLRQEYEDRKRGASKLADAAGLAAEVRKRRFEGWIQGCWTLFLAVCLWLLLRILAAQGGTDLLRLGPNDEGLALAFFLFLGLSILLANETWRRACYGLPIRKQRRAS
ncbi:MAG: helix-turn-helix transcriptional regulator [Paracoccus sp. (in: a-proteobacteria)]